MPEFIAFIDREKAEELEIKIEEINNPYQIWNKEELGVVFGKEMENSPEFKKYENNPNYAQKYVSCGN